MNERNIKLDMFGDDCNNTRSENIAVNVSSVPQISPFRYPGGKTWLFPWIKLWLHSLESHPTTLVDVFAGGGSVALAAVFKELVQQAILIELDEDVASVWQTMLGTGGERLANKIADFRCSVDSVNQLVASVPATVEDRALRTLILNRTRYGGILAHGAASIRNGENGRGISSRWYPDTISRRIRAISGQRNKLHFIHEDSMRFLEMARRHRNVVYFIDPPYTVAGRRLYTHTEIDHERLFHLASNLNGDVLFTYDNAAQIRGLAQTYGFQIREVAMRGTKNSLKHELLVARDLSWIDVQT